MKTAPCDRCGDPRAVYTLPRFCVCPVCDKGQSKEYKHGPPEKAYYQCGACGSLGKYEIEHVAAGRRCHCGGRLVIQS